MGIAPAKVEAGEFPTRGRLGTGCCETAKPDPRPCRYFCDVRVRRQGGGDPGMEVETGAFDVEVVLTVQALAFFLVPGQAGVGILFLVGGHCVHLSCGWSGFASFAR